MSQILWTVGVIAVPFVLGGLQNLYASRRARAAQPLPPGLANAIRQPQNSAAPGPPPPKPSLTPRLKFILACFIIHQCLIAFEVLFNPPTNIFTALNLPPNMLVSQIRRKLVGLSESPVLPPHLEQLLSKFQSFDTRDYYIRFGHETIVSCFHCRSFYDYLLYYAVKVAAEYIRLGILMIIMTIKGSGKRKWRKWGLALVIAAFFADVGQIWTVDIFPRNGFDCEMWHDRIWYIRHAFFFAAPLILHFLPYTYLKPSPFQPLIHTSLVLDKLVHMLNLATIIQLSAQRNEVLRERTNEFYASQELEARVGREDETLMAEAERLGFGYREPVEGENAGEGEVPPTKLRDEAKKIASRMTEMLQSLAHIMTAPPPPGADD